VSSCQVGRGYDRPLLPLRDNVPTRTLPVVTIGLIAANTIVWLWELGATESGVERYAYYPCALDGPCLDTGEHVGWLPGIFSSMFMHGSWLHFLGNMLFLWIFGNNVEDALGRMRFLVFYLLCGVVATLGQTFITLHYSGAEEAGIPNLGASGAIAGVLGAYILLLPSASVLTFVGFFLVPIPAVLFLGIWFLLQAWQGGFSITQPETGGGVAFFAHIFGFGFGFAAVRVFAVRDPLRPSW
jgi:membrane associated rhomboid family serine protease